jgi:hypothetical protein
MERPSVDDILRKHGARIEGQMGTINSGIKNDFSREYTKFKEEMSPDLSRYERWCHTLGSVIKLKVSSKEEAKIRKNISIAHLDIEPWQALTLSVITFMGFFVFGILASLIIALITGAFPALFFFMMVLVSVFLFYFMNGYTLRLANKWRLKASSQMVPAILYIVVYMRHTPNIERAIQFASEHLEYPLALDFKKVFYDVSIGKFSTIKESLDNYLEVWRDYSIEFIESFHLIESSLFEPDEERRITTLEKSLQVVLDGVYDKMLLFTHNVRSPLTNVYMLGVVLPTLSLALLPLASAMIGDLIKWYHVMILFDLLIPFFVFYLTDKVILLRPGGYGETSLLERNPLYPKYISKKPYYKALLVLIPFIILGILPFIFQYTPLPEALGISKDYTFTQLGIGFLGKDSIFGFLPVGTGFTGPFGIVALFLGMLIPLSIAIFFSSSYKQKTKELIVERDKTRQLENEFNNSLFQLGNTIGNGTPPELAFGKVAESSKGLITEDFFRRVNYNVAQMGMDVDKAIFDKKAGAISYYPSELIATSMRILTEAAKKGLKIAAMSLMSISEYVKNIQKITSRLKDMLAEIVSDMKSNMTFLAPLLSGVVVGLSFMITSIIGKLSLSNLSNLGTIGGVGNVDALLGPNGIFKLEKMIPPYHLQIIIGIYLIEIVFILTRTLVAIDSGEDKLERTNKTAKNLMRGMGLYFITALITTFILFIISSVVLGNLVS